MRFYEISKISQKIPGFSPCNVRLRGYDVARHNSNPAGCNARPFFLGIFPFQPAGADDSKGSEAHPTTRGDGAPGEAYLRGKRLPCKIRRSIFAPVTRFAASPRRLREEIRRRPAEDRKMKTKGGCVYLRLQGERSQPQNGTYPRTARRKIVLRLRSQGRAMPARSREH